MKNFAMTTTPAIHWIDERLGMPVCGHAFGVSTGVSTVVTGSSVKGHLGLVIDAAYVPGTLAWSPPLC